MSKKIVVEFTPGQAEALIEAVSYGLYEWEAQLKEDGYEPIGDEASYNLAMQAYAKIIKETGGRNDH